MTRPSEQETSEALSYAQHAVANDPRLSDTEAGIVNRTLEAALKPREVWPAKEAAACLGVETSNMKHVRGLAEAVAWEFPRPQMPLYPDRTEKLYWRDVIERLAEQKRAGKGGVTAHAARWSGCRGHDSWS